MSPESELKTAVAAEYGLNDEAAKFLVGETVDELEASATALAKLVGRDEPEPADQADLFAGARVRKVERQQVFMEALTGRTRPRDEHGRFASGSGFDGGARGSVPARPPETHDQWLADVLRHRRADAGASF